MAENEPPEPTFRVEHESLGDEYAVDEIEVLVPQFQPSRLSEVDRELYDALRETEWSRGGVIDADLATRITGAQVGETVALREIRTGFEDAADALRRAFLSLEGPEAAKRSDREDSDD